MDEARSRRERVLADGDYHTLIYAICENPADDLPRMALADLLDEIGQPKRARLIRCMLELDSTPETDPQHARLRAEATSSLAAMKQLDGWAWLVGKPKPPIWSLVLAGWRGNGYVWRGFLHTIILRTSTFLSEASELFAAQPVVEVSLVGKRPVQLDVGYCWRGGFISSDSTVAVLPEELNAIAGTHYPTEEAAYQALSDECVRFGRRQAVLPDLGVRQ